MAANQRFDVHPRLARIAKEKKPTSALGDDPAQYQLFWGLSEKAFRENLFADLCSFCRQNNSWVVTPPNEGVVRIQVAEGSQLVERLRAWPRYPVIRLGKTSRLSHGKFVDVDLVQLTLWR
jgi:hypothetical protein